MKKASSEDERINLMRRALDLARRGEALASPNPMVGAVLLKNGRIVGEGFHTYDGRRHAEVVAIEAARSAARGATLYINLEPCCHTGRTPPCTRAIIAAGVKRVVAAMEDPNPAVAGRGFAELRAAGIDVEVGVLRDQAQRLNEAFAKWIITGTPFVTLKAAMTLDHQLVLPAARGAKRRRRWITSAASRAEVQRMRHASDALITGIGTVLADNPLLTDRSGLPRRRPLLRVVLDSRLRLDPRSLLVRSANGDVAVFTHAGESSRRARALRDAGVEVVNVAALAPPAAQRDSAGKQRGNGKVAAVQSPKPDLAAVLAELGRRQITSVLLESGARLNDAALAGDLVDKIRVFYAPFRALSAKHAAAGTPSDLSHWGGRAVSHITVECFGPDVAIEAYLRDVYNR